MRILIFSFLVLGILNARENPFVPANGMSEKNIKATNVVRQYDDFDKKIINLPSHARVLKYIKVGYQVLDGSIKEKKLPINGNIDWHEPLVLTTQSALIPAMPMAALENTLKEDDIIGTEEAKSDIKKEVVKKVKQETKEKIIKEEKQEIVEKKQLKKSFTLNSFLSFEVEGKTLILHTKDKLIRDFITLKPRKIVFDFKRNNSFYTKTQTINLKPFKSVTMGSHKDFYRASFLLDGPYLYSITKYNDEIIIKLR